MTESRVWRALLAMFWLCGLAWAQAPQDLRVGLWVAAKGNLDARGEFLALEIEALAPAEEEELIATATAIDSAGAFFDLLGMQVAISDRVQWEGIRAETLAGQRVKVEGHWRGGRRFSAREISLRGAGRDRIVGRIDRIESEAGGGFALSMLGMRVRLAPEVKIESEVPLAQLALAPETKFLETGATQLRQAAEDRVLGSIRLGRDWTLGLLWEMELENEGGYDLDRDQASGELKQLYSLRAQLAWNPSEHFEALFSPRYEVEVSDRQDKGHERTSAPHWSEAWVALHLGASMPLDFYLGRQRFDDQREWLYKRNLDAVRMIWSSSALRLELSASTAVDDGSDRDENSNNWIAYLSNRDEEQHFAAYIIDRRDDRDPRDYPFHYGVRAIGEFIPSVHSWTELAGLSGYADDRNLRSYAFDLGATWQPDWAKPWYMAVGYAWASGDDPDTNADESYRQTGLQKNNGKFGGVTNFRYYGELLDPELSNLGIATLALGVRPTKRVSIDLVWHAYQQNEAAPFLRNAQLRTSPDGVHTDIGTAWDLVIGVRPASAWDLEFIVGQFLPGDAFPGADSAWFGAFQWRQRW